MRIKGAGGHKAPNTGPWTSKHSVLATVVIRGLENPENLVPKQ